MRYDHFAIEHLVTIIYDEWDDERGAAEDAITVQRDAGTALCVRQRDRELVLSSSMARELARVLILQARAMEAE